MCVGRNSNILSFFSSVLIVTSILNRGIAISGLDYIIYFLFIVYFLIETDYVRRIVVPKRYFKVLIVLVLLYIINALFSEFSPSFPYVVLGSLFTILPFLHFVVNYNYNFSEEKISEYIDVLIKTILIIVAFVLMESVLFNPTKYVGSPIGSNIFMIGFFASLCNQGLILSISQYFRHKERKYIYCAAFLVCVIMLTFQIKAIVGMCLILAGYFFINFKNKVRAVLTIAVCFVLSAAVMWSIPAFQVKLLKYIRIYDITNEENNNIARIALYHTSFRIAEDYFPLGTGQGTYGSIPVNIVGSDVYAHYDIDEVYGISDKHDVDFKMDTPVSPQIWIERLEKETAAYLQKTERQKQIQEQIELGEIQRKQTERLREMAVGIFPEWQTDSYLQRHLFLRSKASGSYVRTNWLLRSNRFAHT